MRVVDPLDGTKLPCLWDDCTRLGDTRYEILVREAEDVDPRNVLRLPAGATRWERPMKTVHYLFCSEAHRLMFLNSHIAMGKLPTGTNPRLL